MLRAPDVAFNFARVRVGRWPRILREKVIAHRAYEHDPRCTSKKFIHSGDFLVVLLFKVFLCRSFDDLIAFLDVFEIDRTEWRALDLCRARTIERPQRFWF